MKKADPSGENRWVSLFDCDFQRVQSIAHDEQRATEYGSIIADSGSSAQALPEIDVELDEPSGAEIALIALGLLLLADRRGYRKAQGAEAARR